VRDCRYDGFGLEEHRGGAGLVGSWVEFADGGIDGFGISVGGSEESDDVLWIDSGMLCVVRGVQAWRLASSLKDGGKGSADRHFAIT
jgi:hypothetical protein